jgi:hypothetical protein
MVRNHALFIFKDIMENVKNIKQILEALEKQVDKDNLQIPKLVRLAFILGRDTGKDGLMANEAMEVLNQWWLKHGTDK